MSDAEIAQTFAAHAEHDVGGRPPYVTLTVLETTGEMERLFENFLCGMESIGVSPIVWSMSAATHRKVTARNITSVYTARLQTPVAAQDGEYKQAGGKAYFMVVAMKPLVIREVIKMGYDVLFFDVDITFSKDPRPWLFSYSADLQIPMNDCVNDRLLNSGVFFVRNNEKTRALVGEWAAIAEAGNCKSWACGDQEIMSALLEGKCGAHWEIRNISKSLVNSEHALKCSFTSGQLHVDVLPPKIFANGHYKCNGNYISNT